MAGKSNKRKKYCCNSSSCSSDSDADPDYTVRLSKRPSPKNIFTSLNGVLIRKNTREVKGLKSSPVTSTMRGKHKCPPKKKDNMKQREMAIAKTSKVAEAKSEPGYLNMGRFKAGRRRRSTSRRTRKSEDETDQETEFSVCRSYRRSKNDQSDLENKGSSCRKGNSDDSNGQRKMKATIFSWLIDSKTIQANTKVFLPTDHNRNTLLKKGILKREGILCFCCNKIFNSAGFTFHGGRRINKPYESIFTVKKQVSLLSCMIQAWNKPEESERRRFNSIETKGKAGDSYDDACMICADGGNLMCCEECNSTYHQSCMGMKEVPVGSWYCPYCVCKFCGDPVRQNDYLLECPQCEKRYHWECHQKRELTGIDMNSIPCAPFCGRSCKEVHQKLERNIVGKKNDLDEGFSWTLLHRMDDDSGIYLDDTYQRTLCHSKLAVAHSLMEDCFEPIVDRHTRIKVIPSVVYNSGANFNRIQFRGFYTAVLEKDEEIISAASLRIHGTNLAEMPFIATSNIHRCKGMCKKLMIAVESALCYLNVEYLVIPSVSERIGSWIEKYGFELLEAKMKKEIMCHNTLMFHDSIRLQKSLVPSYLPEPGRKSGGTSMRKARNNHPQNRLSFRKQATMASLLDLNLQPRERNKKPWIFNNRDRMTYRLN